MAKNPFQPSEAIGKYFKALFWGESGSGKTVACLSFREMGRVAYIDTERSTDLYLSELGEGVDIFRTTDLNQIEEALKFIKDDGGKTYSVVVLDSISPVYQTLLEAEMKRIEAKQKDRENPYTKTNIRIRYLYNDLVALPLHVIVTARQAEKYISDGNFFKSVGSKADSSKDVNYPFDFVIEMAPGSYKGTVIKQRMIRNKLPVELNKVDYAVFKPVIEQIMHGKQLVLEDERLAVDRMVKKASTSDKPVTMGVENFTNKVAIARWFPQMQSRGWTQETLLAALGVKGLGELGTMTMKEAEAILIASKETADAATQG